MTAEDKKALLAGPQLPYTIIAGDMNAALYQQDVQRAKFDIQDASYQEFIRDLHLHTTDPDKYPNREYYLLLLLLVTNMADQSVFCPHVF